MGVPATPPFKVIDVASRDAALRYAQEWVALDPINRSYYPIAATNSMLPYFNENSFSLSTKSDGSDIKKGDLVIYKASDQFPMVIHQVGAVNPRCFIPVGVNNGGSDGWRPRKTIQYKSEIIRWEKVDPKTVKYNR